MPNIVFRCQMFRGDWDQIWSQMRMLWMMEALCRVNQTHLRQFEEFRKRGLVERGYPSVYRSGLHYETEKGTEIWPDIPSCLMGTMGKGIYPGPWCDCEDLACYRVAELRELPYHFERPAPWDKTKTEVADPRYPQASNLSPTTKPNPFSAPPFSKPNPFSASPSSKSNPFDEASGIATWPGWKRVEGGIKAKPFAKWRRGPTGNYHYHALTYLPDGRLEDPSLVLGMGREKEFAAAGTAEKLKDGAPVVIQFAKSPEVMVVDPEKPSGYGGGIAPKLDKKVLDLLAKKGETLDGMSGDAEMGAYLSNEILLGATEFDVDGVIGWSREHKMFLPKDEDTELRRLLGYSEH
jgi:hypothetical protein